MGDVERSPEAKEIMRLVTEHTVTAAAHGSKTVLLYSESLIAGIRQVSRVALQDALVAERSAAGPRWCGAFLPCLRGARSHTSPTK